MKKIVLIVLSFWFLLNNTYACNVTENFGSGGNKKGWKYLAYVLDHGKLKREICRANSTLSSIQIKDYKDGTNSSGNTEFTLSLRGDGCNFNFIGEQKGESFSFTDDFNNNCLKTWNIVKSERLSNSQVNHYINCPNNKIIVLLENKSNNRYFYDGGIYGNINEGVKVACRL